jgi:hypothetical protein
VHTKADATRALPVEQRRRGAATVRSRGIWPAAAVSAKAIDAAVQRHDLRFLSARTSWQINRPSRAILLLPSGAFALEPGRFPAQSRILRLGLQASTIGLQASTRFFHLQQAGIDDQAQTKHVALEAAVRGRSPAHHPAKGITMVACRQCGSADARRAKHVLASTQQTVGPKPGTRVPVHARGGDDFQDEGREDVLPTRAVGAPSVVGYEGHNAVW